MIYDDVIMRTIIDLPSEQMSELEKFCKSQGISRAEAVRRAVAKFLNGAEIGSREKAFGAWQGNKLDSEAHVRKLRDEWES